eukprot:TRINITY_DN61335_c0_g1_i1.p1 TRINITY_DN61335_c0_g1~~TRINITY_DN61335_c0_g1_i1.p1  ORF type:complete len:601 (-),score=96.17 TRINITY_DN61335_c0_g1_i1:101-1903(-)
MAKAVKRTCTDCLFLVVFFLALAALGAVMIYANRTGDIRRLFHGMSYHGDLCGVDNDSPYLFFCQDAFGMGTLDLNSPICTDECPKDGGALQTCLTGPTQGYATYSFAGRLCVPTKSELQEQVMSKLGSNLYYSYTLKVSELPEAWLVLLASAVFATIIGYIFLYTLEKNVKCWMTLFFCAVSVLPIVGGVFVIWSTKLGGGTKDLPIEDTEFSFWIGVVMVVFGIVIICIGLCLRRSLEAAIGCISAACEAIFHIPVLLLVPVFELLYKGLIFFGLLYGLLTLVSCGDMNVSSNGVFRTVTFSNTNLALSIFFVFMIIWIMELCRSLSQFVVAFATQNWYFTPYEDGKKTGRFNYAIAEAYLFGVTFHLGTLAFGSFLLAFLRALRLVFGACAKASKDTGNPIGSCIARVCGCIVACFERTLQLINKNAYIDVAIFSNSFCVAGSDALAVIVSEVAAVAVLNGATLIIALAAVSFIAFGSGCVAWALVAYLPMYSSIKSSNYIADPIMVGVVGGFIGMLIAVCFMTVFDTVSDTVLYCFALDKKNSQLTEVFVPNASEASHNDSGWGFLTCGRKPPQPKGSQRVEYAPPVLRDLIANHR